MANPVRPSYRLNLNRNPTRKWAEAQRVDYDGDDWGDDDDYDDYGPPEPAPAPASAGPQTQSGWGQRGGQFGQRSFTNPALTTNIGRTSFDREDERRNFSAGGYDSRFPSQPVTAYHSQERPEYQTRDYGNQLPLVLNTQTHGHPMSSTTLANPMGAQRGDAHDMPYSAPVGHASQRDYNPGFQEAASADATRAPEEDVSGGFNVAPAVARSTSHQQGYLESDDLSQPSEVSTSTHAASRSLDAKPLPFIRPADIYKRVEEEREKERRSQDSARPSLDSSGGPNTGSPRRSGDLAPAKATNNSGEDSEVNKRMRSTLDTVTERKSEYGLNLTNTGPIPASGMLSAAQTSSTDRGTTLNENTYNRPVASRVASSIYTDPPDPVSASSTRSQPIPAASMMAGTPSAETPLQPVYHYSPSTQRFSGLQDDSRTEETDDLPNFDHGISPHLSPTPSNAKQIQSEVLQDKKEFRPPPSGQLAHQPSLGYKSAVQRAFDAENTSALSTVNTRDTQPRSDSESTSDISPIVERKPEFTQGEDYTPDTFTQTMPGQSVISPEYPKTATTTKAPDKLPDNTTILPASTFTPEHHRDMILPSIEEGKARRPLSVEIPKIAEAQHGVLSSTTAPNEAAKGSNLETLPAAKYGSTARSPAASQPSSSRRELVPPATSRTASEDWHDWQAQRRQFNAKHGIEDSNNGSPALSSPISRAESPAKGTVRDIAERLESNSGQTSPVAPNLSDENVVAENKTLNVRNENFRPALPGGWQSYTTDTSTNETPEGSVRHLRSPLMNEQDRTESTDSLPTAKAPRQWQTTQSGPVEAAFAAAAAAGTAMVGAFSGPALTHDTPQDSDDDTEDGDYPDTNPAHPPDSSETRDFALTSPQRDAPVTDPKKPVVQPPMENRNVILDNPSAESDEPIDFPAPLRMSRIGENKQPSPRLSVHPVATHENEQDPEQLQHDIVQSLTPKTSSITEPSIKPAETPTKPTRAIKEPSRQFSIISHDGDVIPREYSSYWQEQETIQEQNKPLATSTEANTVTDATPRARPPIPTTRPISDDDIDVQRPFLEQRYSWETGLDGQGKTTEPTTSDNTKGIADNRPSTPVQVLEPPSLISPPTPVIQKVVEEDVSEPTQSRTSVAVASPVKIVSPSAFPRDKMEFKNIIALNDPSQRIRALDENRRMYSEYSGLLEQWLSSMSTSEHSDVVRSSRMPRAQPNTPVNDTRPSPRRDMTSSSGTKQMQEDGKKLLAAAGKYSGKAGTVAKGIFARGKDKFRTGNTGEKVASSHRRKSSSIDTSTTNLPRSRESVLPDNPPQIPTPALATPTGEPSWSTISTKIDQMFEERYQHPVRVNSKTETHHLVTNERLYGSTSQVTAPRPPAAVLASLPGRDDSAAKSQVFPNYGVGDEGERHTIMADASKNSNQTILPRAGDALSKVSTEDDRSVPRQRMDSLPVPRERRPSSISDVSDISAQEGTSEVLPRNVSPALENQAKRQIGPMAFTQEPDKEEEALKDRTSLSEGTLPAYSSTTGAKSQKRQSRIAPGTQIIPVTELKDNEHQGDSQVDSRPFSFFGSETLNHALAQQAGLNRQPEHLQQSSTDSSSVVDIEKSPRPDITEHPAYRNMPHNESSQVSENPLPSARRAPQDLEQNRQRQQVIVPQHQQTEEGYRIPGPYVQEYRSPRSSKPTVGQDPFQKTHESLEGGGNVATPSHYGNPGDRRSQIVNGPQTQLEPRPNLDHDRDRRSSGAFGVAPQSQNQRPPREAALASSQSSQYAVDDGRRRRGFFGLGNRSSSPNRSNVAQDTGRGRKLSIDMLRSSGTSSKPQPENKKKRSSGFSALFSRSADRDKNAYRPQRNASVPLLQSSQPSFGGGNQHPNQIQYPASAGPYLYGPQGMPQGAYPQYAQPPIAANETYVAPSSAYHETQGYYRPSEQQQQHEQVQSGNRDWHDAGDRSHVCEDPLHGARAVASRPSQVYQSPQEQTQPGSSIPPVPSTRANRDISYGQDRPYVPPASPRSQGGPSPIKPQTGMADHVKNLHKRSRSPRLGRPPSDEHLSGNIDPTSTDSTAHRLSPDPATQLGMFHNRKVSPGGGVTRPEEDQEPPWTIGLPDNGEEDRREDYTHPNHPARQAYTHRTVDTPTESQIVSPTTPHHSTHRDIATDIISPVTAVEPKGRGFDTVASGNTNIGLSKTVAGNSPTHQSRSAAEQVERADPVSKERIIVPPSISSAAIIPHPNPQEDETIPTSAARVPDTQPTTNQSPAALDARASRNMKKAMIEQTPPSIQSTTSAAPKHQTVAEQVLGIQPVARGVIPEHRSTTPVPHSPAPSIGTVPKSTTWPDQKPNTTAVSTTNTSGTTVTTTTLRTGSKLGKGSVRTSTYIVDSNTPSRASSNAAARASKAIGNITSSTPASGPVPLAPVTGNVNNTQSAQSASGPKNVTPNGAYKTVPGKTFDAIELPGSRPDGYESEEEIVMSATAYPGQEWMPEYAVGTNWDD